MNNRCLILILAFTIVGIHPIQAQSKTDNVSLKIAQRMKDSLSLSEEQKKGLYDVNARIDSLKIACYKQYRQSHSLGIYMQKIESSRDSLYKPFLTEQQYILYRKKKHLLVNNNP